MRIAVLSTLLALSLAPVMILAQSAPGDPAGPEKEKATATARAKALVASKLGLKEDRLEVESAARATWPDASLGCPEKGRMYAQVLTSGYRVLLKSDDGKKHEVHVAGRQSVLCAPKPD